MYRALIYPITVLIFVAFVITPQGVSGDQFLPFPIKLNHDPTICAIEPQPDQEFPSIGKKLLDQTEYSVLDWNMKLNEGLGKHPLWNIKLIKVPLSSQNSFDYSSCEITIHFLPKPAIEDLEFVAAGITIPNFETGKTNIEIYYLGLSTKATWIDLPGDYYTIVPVPYYTGYLDTDPHLGGTIRHEIGHSLGLGHYAVGDTEREQIVNGMEDMPSIMIDTITVIGVTHFDITSLDVSEIRTKYGTQGFNNPSQGNEFKRIHIIRTDKSFYQPEDPITVSVDTTAFNAETHAGLYIIDSFGVMTELFGVSKTNSTVTLNSGGYKEGKYYAELMDFNDSAYDYTSFTIGKNIPALLTPEPAATAQIPSPAEIPVWIKNNAKWWSEGSLTDDDFIKGIQYLIQQGIITIPPTQSGSATSQQIPVWIKNNARWWADDQISDDEFVKGIQYLISNGILKVKTS